MKKKSESTKEVRRKEVRVERRLEREGSGSRKKVRERRRQNL